MSHYSIQTVIFVLCHLAVNPTGSQLLNPGQIQKLSDFLGMVKPLIWCNVRGHPAKFYQRTMKARLKTSLAVKFLADNISNIHENLVICADEFEKKDILDIYVNSDRFKNTIGRPWLVIFSESENEISETLKNMTIPVDRRLFFHDNQAMTLSEMYTINDITVVKNLAFWANDNSTLISLEGEDFLKRRADFMGIRLRAVLEDQRPYIFFKDHQFPPPGSQEGGEDHYEIGSLNVTSGMFLDILGVLEEELNFTTTILRR